MYQLETYEWSNIWWEHAPDGEKPRILIVGDSITVGYRGHVIDILREKEMYADAYSTSKSVDNPFYLEELDLIIRQSKKPYALIHFNCGLHGFHLPSEGYAFYYETAVRHLRDRYPETALALVLSTPVTVCGHAEQLADINAVVEVRNDKVREIAAKFGLPVNDLYVPMLGRPELRNSDGYHYNDAGCRYQGELVAEFLERTLE